MKALLIYGPTSEPIDTVRSITNFSTGKTGCFLSNYLVQNHEVYTLKARSAPSPSHIPGEKIFTFSSSMELKNECEKLISLHHFDWVICNAAISDYVVDGISTDGTNYKEDLSDHKMSSDPEFMYLKLKKNPKFIKWLSKELPENSQIVGFKLTVNPTEQEKEEKVKKVLSSKVPLVIHNNLMEITPECHPGEIWQLGNPFPISFKDKAEMAKKLESVLSLWSLK